MVLRGLFGDKNDQPPQSETVPRPDPASDETESVRRISSQIAALPMEQRHFIAGFAYVLARAAHADMDISEPELRYIEKAVIEVGHLTQAQAVLVVEMARNMNELYGATEDYVVTRQLTHHSTPEQREDLLRTAFAVGAADDTITAAESAELNQIGKELGFPSEEIDAIRDEFRDRLAAIQAMRQARGG